MTLFEHIVVGKGLIGSAAARHRSELSDSVAIVGPDEPSDPTRHGGVFASHYDQGRLTRLVGRNVDYSKIAKLAIDAYPSIELSPERKDKASVYSTVPSRTSNPAHARELLICWDLVVVRARHHHGAHYLRPDLPISR